MTHEQNRQLQVARGCRAVERGGATAVESARQRAVLEKQRRRGRTCRCIAGDVTTGDVTTGNVTTGDVPTGDVGGGEAVKRGLARGVDGTHVGARRDEKAHEIQRELSVARGTRGVEGRVTGAGGRQVDIRVRLAMRGVDGSQLQPLQPLQR